MKIEKIISLAHALGELVRLDREKEIKLTGTTRIKIAENFRALENHVRAYQEARNAVIQDLGTPVEGNPEAREVKPDSANWAEFQAQSKAMNDLDRAVTIEPITKDELFRVTINPENQNQVPIDVIDVFLTNGLLTK